MAGLRPCFRLTGGMMDSELGDWHSDVVTKDSLSASAETEKRIPWLSSCFSERLYLECWVALKIICAQ